jgi:hypothetical protein
MMQSGVLFCRLVGLVGCANSTALPLCSYVHYAGYQASGISRLDRQSNSLFVVFFSGLFVGLGWSDLLCFVRHPLT